MSSSSRVPWALTGAAIFKMGDEKLNGALKMSIEVSTKYKMATREIERSLGAIQNPHPQIGRDVGRRLF